MKVTLILTPVELCLVRGGHGYILRLTLPISGNDRPCINLAVENKPSISKNE